MEKNENSELKRLVAEGDQYQSLVEDCRAIITQRVKNSRFEVIAGHTEVGERIINDPLYQKSGKGNRAFLKRLFSDAGLGERTGYYCLEFYEKYIKPTGLDVCNALQTVLPQLGDDISWSAIVKVLNGNPDPLEVTPAVTDLTARIVKNAEFLAKNAKYVDGGISLFLPDEVN